MKRERKRETAKPSPCAEIWQPWTVCLSMVYGWVREAPRRGESVDLIWPADFTSHQGAEEERNAPFYTQISNLKQFQ